MHTFRQARSDERSIRASRKHAYIMLIPLNPTFFQSQRNKTVMNTMEVPEVCALAINNLPIVGRPIWRLTEGKHIVKLEITWQLPRSTTTRRTNQRSKTKRKLPAEGVIQGQDGATKMADHSKMAAPTLPTTTDQLNVARCASPSTSMESREKTPPRPSTPSTAAVTTTDRPLRGNGRR